MKTYYFFFKVKHVSGWSAQGIFSYEDNDKNPNFAAAYNYWMDKLTEQYTCDKSELEVAIFNALPY